ncbi:MAG: hypothetical protein AABY04_02250 [Candidatus Micrarchaeota archaeon]
MQEEKRSRTAEEKPSLRKDHAFFGVLNRALGSVNKEFNLRVHLVPLHQKGMQRPTEVHLEYKIGKSNEADETGHNKIVLGDIMKGKKLLREFHDFAVEHYSVIGLKSHLDREGSLLSITLADFKDRRKRPQDRAKFDSILNAGLERLKGKK